MIFSGLCLEKSFGMTNREDKLFLKIKQEEEKRVNILAEGNRKVMPNLLAISKARDDYFLFYKLKLYCEYLSYHNIVHDQVLQYSKADFLLIDDVLKIIEHQYLGKGDFFDIYWNIKTLYEAFDIDNSELFYQTLAQVEKISATSEIEEVLEIFSFLSNYCIKKVNTGREIYLENLLFINARMVNTLYNLESNQVVPPGIFNNIVKTALRIKNPSLFNTLKIKEVVPVDTKKGFEDGREWAEKFIDVYTKVLAPAQQLVIGNYCQAMVAFEQKNFEKAHELLVKLKHKQGIFINLNIKKIFVQVQFERFNKEQQISKVYDELSKALEAYRGMIRSKTKKQELNYQLSLHHDFYNFCRTLFNLYAKQHKIRYKNAAYQEQKTALKQKVESINAPSYKSWLLDKIDGLK